MSKRLRDRMGNEWTLIIDYGVLRRVRDELGINLLELSEDASRQPLMLLLKDPLRLLDVLWVLVSSRQTPGPSREAFDALWDGATLDAAREALIEGIIDFFPLPEVRSELKKVLAQMRSSGSSPASSASAPSSSSA